VVDPVDKVPPPQRCSTADLEDLTDRLFVSRDHEVPLRSGDLKTDQESYPIAVSLLLDIVTDLRDMRSSAAAPADDPAERVAWHLAQLAAEFSAERCRGTVLAVRPGTEPEPGGP
jgi:hypothetical protein